MADLFDSAWLKWYWANVHAQKLENEVNTWIAKNHAKPAVVAQTRYEPRRHCVVLYVEELLQPFPIHWGLILGDVAHAFRSSLDHLAWALVQRGTRGAALTEEQKKRVYFPLTSSPRHFTAASKRMLPGVRRTDLAKVRRYQPYVSDGIRGVPRHVLTQLDRLSNADKHRTIQPAIAAAQHGRFKINAQYDCTLTRVRREAPAMPLEVGTEIGWFYVRKSGPNPQLQVAGGDLSTYPALSGTTFKTEEWIVRTLVFTGQLLREFAEPPATDMPTIHPAYPASPSKG